MGNDLKSDEQRIALVTGASRGIGRAIALGLAASEDHYAVAVNYHKNKEAAEAVVASIVKAGGNAKAFQADVANAQSVADMFDAIHQDLGAVDVLVNNAGILSDAMAAFMKDEQWQSVIDTNLTGAFNCSRIAMKDMLKKRWGRIVNVASDSGRMGDVMRSNYAAAKAGLIGLTMAHARELAKSNVLVNCVSPGFTETDMVAGTAEATKNKQSAMIPVGRFARPEEIADAVIFLAKSKNTYITGQTLSVDGGLYIGS